MNKIKNIYLNEDFDIDIFLSIENDYDLIKDIEKYCNLQYSDIWKLIAKFINDEFLSEKEHKIIILIYLKIKNYK